jgi:DNA (cytosine-5)-methyltransferase 1
MAVAAHYSATVAWHCEFDKHPSAILAHHYPDIPNHHDVTSVDWAAVEPVDIITGGYPCQPFSHAGQRRGINDERHLWPYVADVIRVLRPRLCVFENVPGHLTLGFDTVLADLAGVGFDAEWGVVSAAEAGAPHRRQRLFIVATDASSRQLAGVASEGHGLSESPQRGGEFDLTLRLLPTPKASDGPNGGPGMRNRRGVADALPGVVTQLIEGEEDATAHQTNTGAVLPSLRNEDGTQAIRGARATGRHDPVHEPEDVWPGLRINEDRGDEKRAALACQETPQGQLRDMRDSQRPARPPHRQEPGEQRPGQSDDVVFVLPSEAALAGGSRQADGIEETQAASTVRDVRGDVPPALGEEANLFARVQGGATEPEDDPTLSGIWGPYAPAVKRWALVLGRPAPAPTEPGKDGRPRLSPRAVEWLMGLPDGWVTGVDIPRSAQLKALGNGVVKQQAALALALLDGAS